jgi:DNA-binding NarL/FixJ family response regulator
MADETVTIVIAASHAVIVEVVRRSILAQAGLEIVGEARDRAGLLDTCRSLRPDVVVLDDHLDETERSLGALRSLREEGVAVAAVVIADRTDGPSVLRALRLGARGYVRKTDLGWVGPAVRIVADGGRAIDSEFEQAAVMALGSFAQQAREGSEVQATLTPREHQILLLVSQGLTMQQAAHRLGISPRTVETHVAKLYRKLGVRTRVQAVARAAQLGLIEP